MELTKEQSKKETTVNRGVSEEGCEGTVTMEDVFDLLSLANQLENVTPIEAATKYYEAVYMMKRHLDMIPQNQRESSTRSLLREKISHYEKVASALMKAESPRSNASFNPRSPIGKDIFFNEDSTVISSLPPPTAPHTTTSAAINTKANQANNKLACALDLDEKQTGHDKNLAIAAYMEAAELYLQALSVAEKHPQSANGQIESIRLLLRRRLESTLDRVEVLKMPKNNRTNGQAVLPQHHMGDREVAGSITQGSKLSAEEIAVLKRSSLIASGLFLPWSDEDAAALSAEAKRLRRERFTDPDGLLALSSKQTARFHKWARPFEIVKIRHQLGLTTTLQEPVMARAITPYTIKQQYVTDCSFIASLCICATLERRFRKSLITSILYPQDGQGQFLYNPAGKYMVKLWLNGVARSVTIDDYLPIDRQGNLLCSHTRSTGNGQHLELWVCLIEKAYMKLCGGYDFPGSNSGVDLFSLTGWIPERVFLANSGSQQIQDFETPPERAWERIFSASTFGDCLMTVSTQSEISKENAEAIGLVTGHAYAVLSVIETKNGTRLLQLKNPWAQKGWKGRYSSLDRDVWGDTAFSTEVGYNAELARKQDDGVFWICWDDVLRYFRNFHLSWNPFLFKFRATVHGFWPHEQGPRDDMFNVGENPQYIMILSDKAIERKATIWVLISRHVAKQEQEGQVATDYLTIHIHRNTSKLDRVWYPGRSGNCILTGAYTNNPQVLIRYDITGPDDKFLSLVLSQHNKSNDLSYTLNCYCTEPFSVAKPQAGLQHVVELQSAWTSALSGGPLGDTSFLQNPMFAVRVPQGGSSIECKVSTTSTIAVHILVLPVAAFGDKAEKATGKPVIDSGKYKYGLVVTDRQKLKAGPYVLVVSNFNCNQGEFRLAVSGSALLKVDKVR